jgi:hypothetical protein
MPSSVATTCPVCLHKLTGDPLGPCKAHIFSGNGNYAIRCDCNHVSHFTNLVVIMS